MITDLAKAYEAARVSEAKKTAELETLRARVKGALNL
jgi:hypothetical protein